MPHPKVEAAKALLKQTDLDRIICIYLSSENATIDWEQAKRLMGQNLETPSFKYKSKKALKPFEDACRMAGDDHLATPLESPSKEDGNSQTVDPKSLAKKMSPKGKIAKRGGCRKGRKGRSRVKVESDEESEELTFDDLDD